MKFNQTDDLIYINQIQSSRVGINLASAYAIVMYNIEWSALSYIQGIARGQSMYSDSPALVYWIFSKFGHEQKIYQEVNKVKTKTTEFYYENQGGG